MKGSCLLGPLECSPGRVWGHLSSGRPQKGPQGAPVPAPFWLPEPLVFTCSLSTALVPPSEAVSQFKQKVGAPREETEGLKGNCGGHSCSPASPMAPHIVLLVLLVQTLQLAGGLSVTQTGPPIMVSLANEKLMFGCSITYQYQPENLQVSYFYTDLQGHNSNLEDTECRPGRGIENQTSTFLCNVTPKLHSAKATGTYYCLVFRGSQSAKDKGTFILVRDSGYQEPPEASQKTLLFCSLGILLVLSVLGTAMLLWRKLWRVSAQQLLSQSFLHPRSAVLGGRIPAGVWAGRGTQALCFSLATVPPRNWRSFCRSRPPGSTGTPTLPAAPSSQPPPTPSTRTFSAKTLRCIPACRARPPPRTFSPRKRHVAWRVTARGNWSMRISRTYP